MIDGDPSRDELKRLLRQLRSGGENVPELPAEKTSLIWEDHTTAVEIPDGNGREYYLDVDGGGLYRFDLTEAWIENLHREGDDPAGERAAE